MTEHDSNSQSRRGAVDSLAPGPTMVLVNPQMGENIGATARAMLNFGLTRLRLVAPRDGWPNEKATAMASGASAVIEEATVFPDTAAALADQHYVLATTARPREMRLPVLTPDQAAAAMRSRIAAGQQCAVMFGSERRGLENHDVLRADAVISIPVNPAFASLNLGQAALVVAYEWATASGMAPWRGDLDAATPATKDDFDRLMAHLFEALEAVDYFHPPEKRPVRERNLTVALARAGLTDGEVRTLRGVIKALSNAGKPDTVSDA